MASTLTDVRPPQSLLGPGQVWHEIDDVPIFDEHVDENETHYDRTLLQSIANNNNNRIQDTGDWCPIVEHHTSDDRDPKKEPKIVGYAGPFWVDKLGDKEPRPCVYTKFWVFPEDVETVRKNPRRSVEIWPEDKPESRFFDPIALQGATTPRRDLGLKYSKTETADPIRYEMAAAGGSNTFIPSMGNEKKPEKNVKGGAMHNTDELRQILEALKPELVSQIEAIIGKSLAATEQDPMELNEMEAGGGGSAGGAIGNDIGGAMYSKLGRYNKDGEWDMDGVDKYMDAHDEDDLAGLSKYMKDVGDECETKQMYNKNFAQMPEESPAEEPDDESAMVYCKSRDEAVTRYRKLSGDHETLSEKYSKLKEDHDEVQAEYRKVVRYSKLRERHDEGFVFNIDEEYLETRDLTDPQFDRHVESIIKYTRVPLGVELPAENGATQDPDAALKYAKKKSKEAKASELAMKRCEEARKSGEALTYAKALAEEHQRLGV